MGYDVNSSSKGTLTVILCRLAWDVQMGGAKGIPNKSPPPAQVIFPVVQTPEIMQLSVERKKEGEREGRRKRQRHTQRETQREREQIRLG